MIVAFYKVDHDGATLVDKAIAWWTSGFKSKFNGEWKKSYSHTEIVFSDGVMISCSPREGDVRAKKHIKSDAHWDYLDLSGLDEETARAFADTQVGKKYDWLGVAGFVIGVRENEKRWFCSELSTRVLQIGGCIKLGDITPARVSPNRLYKLLKRR